MSYHVHLHKDAQKALRKAPQRIQRKAVTFIDHLLKSGTKKSPFPIKTLKGSFKKFKYHEAAIDKDYRIIFRREENHFFIRHSGTHNALRTGQGKQTTLPSFTSVP